MKVVKLKALGERGDTLTGEQPKIKIKVEAEEYNENSTVVVDESLTLKFEENVKPEPEDCSINVEKMTIEDIKKMIRDISNENKTLRKSLQAKCKNNDMKKAKLRTMSKKNADLETKVKKTEQERDLAKRKFEQIRTYSASLYGALTGNFDNPDSMTGYPANQGSGYPPGGLYYDKATGSGYPPRCSIPNYPKYNMFTTYNHNKSHNFTHRHHL